MSNYFIEPPCPKLFIPRKDTSQASQPDQMANWLAIEKWANNFPCGGVQLSAQLQGPFFVQGSFKWTSFEFNDSGFTTASTVSNQQGIVVPRAGVYLATFMIHLTAVSPGTTPVFLELSLYKNTTLRISALGPWINTTGTTWEAGVTISNLIKCSPGDNINTSYTAGTFGISGPTTVGYLGASYQSA